MDEIVRTAAEVAAGGMSVPALIGIIVGLIAVIQVLLRIVEARWQRKTNPLNGTLVKLDDSVVKLNTVLAKIDMRTEDSNRALEGHTEKLIVLGSTMAQLAVNETRQTEALMKLGTTLDASLTGVARRITEHCNARSQAICGVVENALDRRG